MSGLDTLKIVDAIQSYDTKRLVKVVDGIEDASYLKFPPQTVGNNNLTFVVNSPSLETGLDRRVMYYLSGTATLTYTVNGGEGAPHLEDKLYTYGIQVGLSESALDQVCSVESVNFSNKQNSVNRNLCGVELNRMYTRSGYEAIPASGVAEGLVKDFACYFEPWVDTNRDVLGAYSDFNMSDQVPTSRANWIRITDGTAPVYNELTGVGVGTITVSYAYYSYSQVSPFSASEFDKPALRGMSNLIFQLQFLGDFSAMFSTTQPQLTTGGYTYTFSYVGCSNNFDASTTMLCRFISPSKFSLNEKKTTENVFSYREIQYWSTPVVTPNSGANFPINLTQITNGVIPSKILIGARDNSSLLGAKVSTLPRSYYPLQESNPVNLKFNNNSFLVGAYSRQIYDISVRNGLTQVPYEQWLGRDMTRTTAEYTPNKRNNLLLGSSFMALDPAKDCAISRNGLTDGTISTWTITGQVNFTNNRLYSQGEDVNGVEMFIITIAEGFCRVDPSNGSIYAEVGLLTKDQSLAVLMDSREPISDAMLPKGAGLSLTKHIANVYNKGKEAVGHVLKHKDALVKTFNTARDLYGKLKGSGYVDDEDDEYTGGAMLDTSSRAVNNKRAITKKYL